MKIINNKTLQGERIDDEIIKTISSHNKGYVLNVLKIILNNLATLAATIKSSRPDIALVIQSIITGKAISRRLDMQIITAWFSDKSMSHIRGYQYPTSNIGYIPVRVNLSLGTCSIDGLDTIAPTRTNLPVIAADANISLDINELTPKDLIQCLSDVLHNIRTLASDIENVRFDIMAALDSIAEEYLNPTVDFEICNVPNEYFFKKPFEFSYDLRGKHYFPKVVVNHATNEISLFAVSNDNLSEILVGTKKYSDKDITVKHLSAFTGGECVDWGKL